MFEFKKVRKKPLEVEAFQLTRELIELKIKETLGDEPLKKYSRVSGDYERSISYQYKRKYGEKAFYVNIETIEGHMRANIGDWIIKDKNGEIYPCKDDIFRKTYDII